MIVVYKADTWEVVGIVAWGHDFEGAKDAVVGLKGLSNRLDAEHLGFRFYDCPDSAPEAEAIRKRGAAVLTEETRELVANGLIKPTAQEVALLQAELDDTKRRLADAEAKRDAAPTEQEAADWEITGVGLRNSLVEIGRQVAHAAEPMAKTVRRVAGIAPAPETP